MRNRSIQRNLAKVHEEKIDRVNAYGITDLTPYRAVKRMIMAEYAMTRMGDLARKETSV